MLRSLIATGQQNDEGDAASSEIDAVAGAVINAHLRHAAAHWPHITRIADLQAVDARLNAPLCPRIAQSPKPTRERFRLANFHHKSLYPMGYSLQGGCV